MVYDWQRIKNKKFRVFLNYDCFGYLSFYFYKQPEFFWLFHKCVRAGMSNCGPRAACGHIFCSMWPAWIFYDPYTIESNNNLKAFKVISSINLVIFILFIYFLYILQRYFTNIVSETQTGRVNFQCAARWQFFDF